MKTIVASAFLGLLCVAAQAQTAPAPAAVVEIGQAVASKLAPTRWVPGSVVSRDDAKIASAEAGRLDFVAEVGTRVKAGERLAKIDDRALHLRREELLAELRRTEARQALSKTQLERLRKLEASSAIARAQLDEAVATLETDAQTAARARAQLRQVEYDISQADVRAPFSGLVTERYAQRGEYLQVGANIVHFVDTERIEARVQAPLALADKVRAGMQVGLRAGGVEQTATVRAVVPVGDERARQFELRVGVDPALALVGSAVEVALPETAAAAEAALAVPRDALVRRPDRTYVMRISGDNKAEPIAVTTGTSSGDLVEVRGALSVGDRLVVRGAERLSAGQAVSVRSGS
ncbi:efflux RND transporter periplasmic adaptor subunit [Dokdonella ginsengisoli]|uniref:Efflux RND transporter periplasmic adaptor subunit n=1 Tax=Dokdonella ginsengisoli TaxID=363846 RepID=A0ABV9QSZ0_9GAMM